MRKFVFLIISLCLCTLMVQAGPVDRVQAQQQAQTFFAQRGKVLKKSGKPYKVPRQGVSAEEAYYYVFKAEGDKGFVIVSGDDRTAPVFGYSDTGSFDENNIPENMRAWLQGYVDEIKALDDETTINGSTRRAAPRKVELAKRPVAPLLTTLWNQTSPYNDNSPLYNGTNKCVTGCVATAMAQVMYYYRAQSVSALTAEIPAYTTKTYGLSVPADPAGSPIDWANMTDTYSGSSTAVQNAAVAALMAYCGHAVQMNYGPSSSALSSAIPRALENYFGYAAGGNSVSRGIYTLDEWAAMVYEELLAGRPLLYSGQSSGGGHAFVVDGYDGEGLFHFNWGWGGSSNGYFLLQVANPGNNSGAGASSSSDGYARSQSAIFGINPTTAEGVLPATPTTNISEVSANSVSIRFWNIAQQGLTLAFNAGVGYVNENGKLTYLTGKNYTTSLDYTYLSVPSFTINAGTFAAADLPAGTYILKPMCKMSGSSEWIETTPRFFNEYVIAEYDGTNVTLTFHQNTPQLSVTGYSYPRGTGTGTVVVKAEVQNDGDEYVDYLYLFASKTTNKGSAVNGYVTIEAGKSASVQFSYDFASEGTYNIWIATDDAGDNVIGQTQVQISAAGAVIYNLTAQGLTLENGNPSYTYAGTIYGSHIKGNVLLKNEGATTFEDDITIQLYEYKTYNGKLSYWSADKQTVTTTIAVGETKAVEFDFSNQNQTQYLIFISYTSTKAEIVRYPTYNSYTLAPGVEITTADGAVSAVAATSSVTIPANAVAVNLTGVTGTVTKVTPNSNPNTLYYMGESETEPTGLGNSNIVKGSNANQIVLTEGYDFFIPHTFTANTVKYQLTPTKGTSGTGGWTTIALPFDVSNVTADGTAIDWFHSSADKDKDFWVRRFVGIDDDEAVLFGNVDRMEANVPYIVAFPTNHWGEEYNLVGKQIVFHGTNAKLIAEVPMRLVTSKINFEGTTTANQVTGSYRLNNAGDMFVLGDGAVSPFQAYFKPKNSDSPLPAKRLIRFYDDNLTGINDLTKGTTDGETAVYTIGGVQLGTVRIVNGIPQTEHLPKGIYIINGKKVIR